MLPTKRKIPSTSLSDYTLFIAGEKKVGKTSFCAQFPKHFILEFECGNAKHINANYEDIPDLATFTTILKDLENSPDYASTVICDEINILYEMLVQDICKTEGILDPQELPFGRGWGAIGRKFRAFINRLQSLPSGNIYTGHSEVKEITTRQGRKINKLEAALMGQPNKIMERITHGWFAMQFDKGSERYLYIEGDDFIKAAHGFKDNFQTITEGKIPLGNSPQQGFTNFTSAWANRLILNTSTRKVQNQKPQKNQKDFSKSIKLEMA